MPAGKAALFAAYSAPTGAVSAVVAVKIALRQCPVKPNAAPAFDEEIVDLLPPQPSKSGPWQFLEKAA